MEGGAGRREGVWPGVARRPGSRAPRPRRPYAPPPGSCRAQAKYREKQKSKKKEAEHEYRSVAAELERLRLENARLQAGAARARRRGGTPGQSGGRGASGSELRRPTLALAPHARFRSCRGRRPPSAAAAHPPCAVTAAH